jgi:succinyl-diaminopimelate desuccinylase
MLRRNLEDDQLHRLLLNNLTELVKAPTFSSRNMATSVIAGLASAQHIELLATQFEQADMYVTRFENNDYHSVIATTQKTKRPRILLNAHLDIVPVKDEQQLILKQEDDRLVGRGVFDMKFAIVCYLQFIRTYGDILNDLDIGIMINSDEETSGFHGAKLLAAEGWGGDIVLVPDGGDNWQIELRAKGLWTGRLVAHGVSAHGSRPWEGMSVAESLIPALREVIELFDNTNKDGTTCTIGTVHLGEAFNQVPAHGFATLDIRSFDEKDFTSYNERVALIAKKYGLDYTVDELGLPIHTDASAPLVRMFANHVKKITESRVVFTPSYGGSDARWFARDGMQPVLIRPTGGGNHGPDEWMLSADLLKFYRLIESFVLDCGKVQ